MQSSPEQKAPSHSKPALRWGDVFQRWNRKLHVYLGLYLLLFVWLFAFTGLLLNHSQWKFAQFWESRHETTTEREIQMPSQGSDLTQARNLMRQLDIRGEIEWTRTRAESGPFEFRVSRPGQIIDVKADFKQNKATLKRIELNAWGVMRILHAFTGVRVNDSRNHRDWALTSLWAWTMDAVAIGMILMVLSSCYLWWLRPRKRGLGAIVLALGFLTCGLFCFGLRILY